jgi:hypothetical protein
MVARLKARRSWILPTIRGPAPGDDRASSKVDTPTVPVTVDGLPLGTVLYTGGLPRGLAEAMQQQRWENPEDENSGRDQHHIHERADVGKL